jgi:hypothetical protein
MSGEVLKEKLSGLSIEPKSGHALVARLIERGFFDQPVSNAEIIRAVREKFGAVWKSSYPPTYTKKFLQSDILQTIKTEAGYYWVVSTISRDEALRRISKGKKLSELEGKLFSDELVSRLGSDFKKELDELHDNFGRNGNCTAFLLRKILEKLIIIVLGKHGKQNLLEVKGQPGRWVGLEEMIEIVVREKVAGVPFMMSKTGREIKGIKFLGDTAAHNPLANVEMNTIIPQMPFIITAYEELAKRLSK